MDSMNLTERVSPLAGAVVFDLDGTILRANSFHLWLNFLMFDQGSPLGPVGRATLFGAAAARGARVISHRTLKQITMRLFDDAAHAAVDAFVDRKLMPLLSKTCLAQLAECRKQEGCATIMATAAPGVYAALLATRLGFTATVSSYMDGRGQLVETIGKKKLEEIRRSFGAVEIAAAFTDHPDDVPLLNAAQKRYIVNAREEHKRVLAAQFGEELVFLTDY